MQIDQQTVSAHVLLQDYIFVKISLISLKTFPVSLMLVSWSVSKSLNKLYLHRYMLRDNALKFYRDQTYVIPQKPIENGQYMNQNGLLKFYFIVRSHMLCDNDLKGITP